MFRVSLASNLRLITSATPPHTPSSPDTRSPHVCHCRPATRSALPGESRRWTGGSIQVQSDPGRRDSFVVSCKLLALWRVNLAAQPCKALFSVRLDIRKCYLVNSKICICDKDKTPKSYVSPNEKTFLACFRLVLPLPLLRHARKTSGDILPTRRPTWLPSSTWPSMPPRKAKTSRKNSRLSVLPSNPARRRRWHSAARSKRRSGPRRIRDAKIEPQ